MEENHLKSEISEQKQAILRKLVNSGINISPKLLEGVLNLDNPMKNLNILIKETSFIPSFKSHLTEIIVHEISNEELQKTLKRVLSKSTSIPSKEEPNSKPKIPNVINESITEVIPYEFDSINSEIFVELPKFEEQHQFIPDLPPIKKATSTKKKS